MNPENNPGYSMKKMALAGRPEPHGQGKFRVNEVSTAAGDVGVSVRGGGVPPSEGYPW